MTLDELAHGLRGMPHTAPILVRMPDGQLQPIRFVRPIHLSADGNEGVAAEATSWASSSSTAWPRGGRHQWLERSAPPGLREAAATHHLGRCARPSATEEYGWILVIQIAAYVSKLLSHQTPVERFN